MAKEALVQTVSDATAEANWIPWRIIIIPKTVCTVYVGSDRYAGVVTRVTEKTAYITYGGHRGEIAVRADKNGIYKTVGEGRTRSTVLFGVAINEMDRSF